MNKITFLIIGLFFSTCTVYAQVLYDDDFENYTLGNLGTDPDGIIPGQGGWFTIGINAKSKDNCLFTITKELGKGKVMTFSTTPPDRHHLSVEKRYIDKLIDKRISSYKVLKFEFDYYTGQKSFVTTNSTGTEIRIVSNNGKNTSHLFSFYSNQNHERISIRHGNGGASGTTVFDGFLNYMKMSPVIPFDTWVKLTVYLDYGNKKIYFENSTFNQIAVSDTFLSLSNSTDLIENFKPTSIFFVMDSNYNYLPNLINNRFDNIKITALKEVPAYIVSANSFLNEQFTIFPNPASSFVNITNTLNLGVEEVSIYDVSGKLLKTQKVVSTGNIQLNIEEFAVGTYLFHIKTKEGTAVKKNIKK